MTPADRKKLLLAGGLLTLALAISAWYVFSAGSGQPSRGDRAAQDQVLEQMGVSGATGQEAPAPAPAAPTGDQPAGRPRPVHPGS